MNINHVTWRLTKTHTWLAETQRALDRWRIGESCRGEGLVHLWVHEYYFSYVTGRSRRVTRQRLQDFINIHNAIPRFSIRIRRFSCSPRERYAEQPWTLPTSAAEGWSFVHSWLNVNTSTAQRQHSRCVAFKNWGKEAPCSRRVSGRFLWSLSPLLQTVGKFPPHVQWFVRVGEPDGVELCARLASAVEESKQELHGRRCVWEYAALPSPRRWVLLSFVEFRL